MDNMKVFCTGFAMPTSSYNLVSDEARFKFSVINVSPDKLIVAFGATIEQTTIDVVNPIKIGSHAVIKKSDIMHQEHDTIIGDNCHLEQCKIEGSCEIGNSITLFGWRIPSGTKIEGYSSPSEQELLDMGLTRIF